MWTRGLLTRYADTLETHEREALKREIGSIQFEDGTEVCVGIEGKQAFVRAGIAHLYEDLGSRVVDLLEEEDMDALRKLNS